MANPLRSRSRSATGIAAAALVILLAAPVRAEDAKPAEIVLANPAISLSFSASYLAEDLGIFKKNGLDVKMIEVAGVGALNAVISGSADFGQPSSLSVTRAAQKGQRLLAIAETSNKPIIQVALRKEFADAGGFDAKRRSSNAPRCCAAASWPPTRPARSSMPIFS